eukprot:jgi/Mesen1/9161/ME000591S08488
MGVPGGVEGARVATVMVRVRGPDPKGRKLRRHPFCQNDCGTTSLSSSGLLLEDATCPAAVGATTGSDAEPSTSVTALVATSAAAIQSFLRQSPLGSHPQRPARAALAASLARRNRSLHTRYTVTECLEVHTWDQTRNTSSEVAQAFLDACFTLHSQSASASSAPASSMAAPTTTEARQAVQSLLAVQSSGGSEWEVGWALTAAPSSDKINSDSTRAFPPIADRAFRAGAGVGVGQEEVAEAVPAHTPIHADTALRLHASSSPSPTDVALLRLQADARTPGGALLARVLARHACECRQNKVPAGLSSAASLRPGSHVTIVGSPFGILSPPHFLNSVVTGVVSNEWPPGARPPPILMVDARCLPGMEGGAVVDHRGALRGMLCRPLRQPAASAEIQLVVTESALVGVLRPFGVRTLPGDSQAPAETPGRAGRRRHVAPLGEAESSPASSAEHPRAATWQLEGSELEEGGHFGGEGRAGGVRAPRGACHVTDTSAGSSRDRWQPSRATTAAAPAAATAAAVASKSGGHRVGGVMRGGVQEMVGGGRGRGEKEGSLSWCATRSKEAGEGEVEAEEEEEEENKELLGGRQGRSGEDAIAEAMECVVLITVGAHAWASGVLLSRGGLVLTNAHLLEPWRFASKPRAATAAACASNGGSGGGNGNGCSGGDGNGSGGGGGPPAAMSCSGRCCRSTAASRDEGGYGCSCGGGCGCAGAGVGVGIGTDREGGAAGLIVGEECWSRMQLNSYPCQLAAARGRGCPPVGVGSARSEPCNGRGDCCCRSCRLLRDRDSSVAWGSVGYPSDKHALGSSTAYNPSDTCCGGNLRSGAKDTSGCSSHSACGALDLFCPVRGGPSQQQEAHRTADGGCRCEGRLPAFMGRQVAAAQQVQLQPQPVGASFPGAQQPPSRGPRRGPRIQVRLDHLQGATWRDAEVVYVSQGPLDVAVLRLEARAGERLALRPLEHDMCPPAPGSPAFVVGHGLFGPRSDLRPSVTAGVVARVVTARVPAPSRAPSPGGGAAAGPGLPFAPLEPYRAHAQAAAPGTYFGASSTLLPSGSPRGASDGEGGRGRERESGVCAAMVQTTAAVHKGNSGGALVNARGALIGLICR